MCTLFSSSFLLYKEKNKKREEDGSGRYIISIREFPVSCAPAREGVLSCWNLGIYKKNTEVQYGIPVGNQGLMAFEGGGSF